MSKILYILLPALLLGSFNLHASNDLTFLFEHGKLTSSGGNYYYEFDVSLKTNTPDLYLFSGNFYIEYSDQAFSQYVVANNNIAVTSPNSNNYQIDIADAPTGPLYDQTNKHKRIVVNIYNKNNIATNPNFTRDLIPSSAPSLPLPIIHVKIKVADCTKTTQLQFVNQSYSEQRMFYALDSRAASPPQYNWNFYFMTNALDETACKMKITEITQIARAGVGEIVTIKGQYFGASRTVGTKKSQVIFSDADDQTGTYLLGMDDQDYLVNGTSEYWTDNEIKVKLAGIVEIPFRQKKTYGTPGSGKIKIIKHDATDAISPTNIDIQYSIQNLQESKKRFLLSKYNGYNGFKFYLADNIKDTLAISAIRAALLQWSSRLGISLELAPDVVYPPYQKQDGKNVVYFGKNIAANNQPTLMSTQSYLGFCNEKNFQIESDIGIQDPIGNKGVWGTNQTGPLGKDTLDFFGAFQHEVGHALGLGHVIEPKDIMHGFESRGLPAADRRTLTSARGKGLEGALDHIVFCRSLTNFTNCDNYRVITSSACPLCEAPVIGYIPSTNISPASTLSLPFTASGTFNAGNVFTAQLSNERGSFAHPVNIGNVTSPMPGIITATIPANVVSAGSYRIRVISSSPAMEGLDNGVSLTIASGRFIASGYIRYPLTRGATVPVNFTPGGGTFNSGNVFTAQLSNASGDFTNPVNIGTLSGTAADNTINATIPSNAAFGSGYKIRVVSSSPAVTGLDNGENLKILNPVLNTGPVSPKVFNTGVLLSVPFSYSDVEFEENNVFTAQLSDANGSFAAPRSIGTIGGASATGVVVSIPTDIPNGAGYRIRIVTSAPAMTGTDNGENLNITALPLSFETGSMSKVSYCPGDGVTVTYTFSGVTFMAGNVFTLQLSDASSNFNNPVTVASVPSTMSGKITSTMPNAAGGTGYRFRIVSTNPVLYSESNPENITISNPLKPVIAPSGPTTFCAGGSVTLTSSNAMGNIWSTGATTSSITVTNAGSYSVKTVINGCTSPTSEVVNVGVTARSPVSVTIAASPTTVTCGNTNIKFTATVTNGGTNPVYQWKVNGKNVGASSAVYSSTSLSSGDNVTCVVTSSTTCPVANPVASNEIGISRYPSPSVNITVSPSAYINAQPSTETVRWKDIVRCNIGNGWIEKKFSNNSAGGAASIQTIDEGGYVIGKIPDMKGMNEYVILGLSQFNDNEHGNTIQYGIKVTNDANLSIVESGVARLTGIKYTFGDYLKIGIVNNKICYYISNNLIYISSVMPSIPMIADVHLHSDRLDPSAKIEGVNIKPYGYTLVFTAHAENAGTNPIYLWRPHIGTSYQSNDPVYAVSDFYDLNNITCKVISSDCGLSTISNAITINPPTNLLFDNTFNTPFLNLQACEEVKISMNLNYGAEIAVNAGKTIIVTSNVALGANTTLSISPCNPITSTPGGRRAFEVSNSEKYANMKANTIIAYPNPFRDETTIRYNFEQSGPARVYISNLVGEQVAELINNKNHASGEHSVVFNSTNCKPGIYFYTLETPNFKETKRLVLMK